MTWGLLILHELLKTKKEIKNGKCFFFGTKGKK